MTEDKRASAPDGAAREEWGWRPDFDLASMTADMIRVLREKHKHGLLV